MIDDDLGTSVRQIWEVAGHYRLAGVVRNIMKEEIGYKSYIHRWRQFISNAVKKKRMECRAHMKHGWDTNLWPLSYPDLNPLDYLV